MEIEKTLKQVFPKIYLESNFRKNLLHLLTTFSKKKRDDKLQIFLGKVQIISALRIQFYMEDKKQQFNIDQNNFECFLCHKDFTEPLPLLIHWLFHHRQYFFKLYLIETIDKSYLLEGLIQKKVYEVKKKDANEKNYEFFASNKNALYEKAKKRLQKIFSKEAIVWTKKKLPNRPIFADEDSDEEEERPNYTQEDIKKELKGRVFYHTKQMFRKVSENSLFVESEEEISDSDIIQAEEEAIDAYDDIEDEDKKFFKLWNRYVHEQEDIRNDRKNMVAFTINEYCQFVVTFVRKNRPTIQKDNLRNSLVMHLTTLHIYGLLSKDEIVKCLLEYESKN